LLSGVDEVLRVRGVVVPVAIVLAGVLIAGGVYLSLRERAARPPATELRPVSPTRADELQDRLSRSPRTAPVTSNPRDARGDHVSALGDPAPQLPQLPHDGVAIPPVPPATPLQDRVGGELRAALADERAALADCWDGPAGKVAVRALFAADGTATMLGWSDVPGRETIGVCLRALELTVRVEAPNESVAAQIELELP